MMYMSYEKQGAYPVLTGAQFSYYKFCHIFHNLFQKSIVVVIDLVGQLHLLGL